MDDPEQLCSLVAAWLSGSGDASERWKIRESLRILAMLEEKVGMRLNGHSMSDIDRRILYLRGYHRKTFEEIALICGLDAAMATHRYVKTLECLRRILDSLAGNSSGSSADRVDEIMAAHGSWLVREVQNRGLRPSSESPAGAWESVDSDWGFVRSAVHEFLDAAPRFLIQNPKLLRALFLWAIQNQAHEDYYWWRSKRIELARQAPTSIQTVLHLD